MYHVVFAHIIHAERERELEEAIRLRQLLKPQDEAIEPPEATGPAKSRRAIPDAARPPDRRMVAPVEPMTTGRGSR